MSGRKIARRGAYFLRESSIGRKESITSSRGKGGCRRAGLKGG